MEREVIERWSVFELVLRGPSSGNPFADVAVGAAFTFEGTPIDVAGFYDGNGTYRVRFMPDRTGSWSYRSTSSVPELDGITGNFLCVEATMANHGPVRVSDTFHFCYADGTRYLPVGTTCYAWTHQGGELEERTLASLRAAPFNKLRMCVFPKHYDFNHNEPALYPFEGSLEQGWDFTRFNPAFFRHLEERVRDLMGLGIEADLILFHPYDRWGFAKMPKEADDAYLRYLVARLAAFRNVWWSLANEYDLLESWTKSKSSGDWDRFAAIIEAGDRSGHLLSVHNCVKMFDHTKRWVTHCSIQRIDVYRTAENTDGWREQYGKPVVIDECGYEGDINHGWGNLTAQELVRRCWEGAVRGGYVGHGETYLNAEEVLWWSKGGELHGSSHHRIAFLRTVLEEAPGPLNPISFGRAGWDLPCGGIPGRYYLFYFGFNQPAFRTFTLPGPGTYQVDVIDTWDMTVSHLSGEYSGTFRVELPAKPYIAVRARLHE